MSSYWKTVKNILKGKAKGSKLIVLGVFLVSIGAIIQITINAPVSGVFYALGALAFGVGLGLYREEGEYELEKKRKKDAQEQE